MDSGETKQLMLAALQKSSEAEMSGNFVFLWSEEQTPWWQFSGSFSSRVWFTIYWLQEDLSE